MRVAVTGCAGFIGSAVTSALLDKGCHVVGIDSLTEDVYPSRVKRERMTHFENNPEFEFHHTSLDAVNLHSVLDGVEVVINEAASPGLVLSWTHYETYVRNNVTTAFALAQAMERAGIRKLVQASTSSVYGAIATGNEESPTRPASPYGVTKLAAEHALSAWAANCDIDLTILRYFSVYGPHQRPDMAYEIFCQKLLSKHAIEVFGDGKQSRSNTYISDVVDATILAVNTFSRESVFNICGGEPIDLLNAVEILSDELQITPSIHFKDPRRGDQRATLGDNSRARSELGWQPKVPVEQGLRLQARAAKIRFERAS